MTNLFAYLFGLNPSAVQLITAMLGLIAATATATSAVVGFLNRRIRKRTETTADATATALQALVKHLAEQKTERDELWTAYLNKDTIANPEGVRRIAAETATSLTAEALRPMQMFYAAVETVESRREHRPETDLIRVLEEITA